MKLLHIGIYSIVTVSILFFCFLGHGNAYIAIWWPRILCTMVAVLAIGSIVHIGFFFSSRMTPSGGIGFLLSLAFGTWGVCTFLLVLGSYALLTPYVAVMLLLLPNALGWKNWKKWYLFTQNWLQSLIETRGIVITSCWLLFCIVGLFNLTHSFLPPMDYDVLEYHLGAPAEYTKAGQVFFLHNNVYANFPQNLEMLAFWMMQILGKFFGAITSQILLQLYGLALASSVYYLTACFQNTRMCTKQDNPSVETDTNHPHTCIKQDNPPVEIDTPFPAALVSAALAYSLPWTGELLRMYYVEVPQIFLLILCLSILVHRDIAPYRRYSIAGCLLGISGGFKYTTLFFILPALSPFLLMILYKDSIPFSRKIVSSFLLVLFATLAFSPWLIRNTIYTGNPIYPLWNNWIIPGFWTESMYLRFRYAHAPHDWHIWGIFQQIYQNFVVGSHASLAHITLLLPVIVYMLFRMRCLLLGMVIWFALWWGYTHRMDRFLFGIWVLLCIPMGPLVSMAKDFAFKKVFTAICIILLLYQHALLTLPSCYDYVLGLKNSTHILQEHHPNYPGEVFLENNGIDENILLVGEARTFYFDMPVVSNTVFDYNFLEELLNRSTYSQQISQVLLHQDIRYIYINWDEVNRLQRTYSFPYNGRLVPGFWDIDINKLYDFLKNYCTLVFRYPTDTSIPAGIEIYVIQ